jgi:acyl-[acyl-carrier-protein]-phospholipid O-acyltransferase/long-chain-fatty-acid--[acyl-carrier-protein] ligase
MRRYQIEDTCIVVAISEENLDRAELSSPLRTRHYAGFLAALFLGNLNDSCFKMIVSLLVLKASAPANSMGNGLAAAGAVFVLPFLLFAGYAGQAADGWSKTAVLQVAKAVEVATVCLGLLAICFQHLTWAFGVLFLLAIKGTFFSPAQSGIVPELLPKKHLSRANGWMFLLSFAALVLGPGLASFFSAIWERQLWKCALPLVAFAIIGWIASLFLPHVPSSNIRSAFRWNPVNEIVEGFREIHCDPQLCRAAFASSYFWFVGALLQITILLFCVERLHAENLVAGYSLGMLSLGLGAGSLAAALLSKDRIDLGIVPVAGCLIGILSFFLSSAWNIKSVLVLLAALGFGGGLFIVPLTALLQYHSSRSRRGRVLATTNFTNMVGVVLASGVISALHGLLGFSAATILITEGLLTLFISAWIIKSAPEPLIRFLLTCLTRISFRIRTVDALNIPAEGGALLVANHVSFADAFVLSCAVQRPIRFVMLQRYFELPGLKWMFRLFRAIPVSNDRPSKAAIRALHEAAKSIADGDLVCIFPEGRRTQTGSLGGFRRGIETVADLACGSPIVPLYLEGLWGIPSSFKKKKALRDCLILRREVTVRVGQPVEGTVTTKSLHGLLQQLGRQIQDVVPTSSVTGDFRSNDELAQSLEISCPPQKCGGDFTLPLPIDTRDAGRRGSV